MSFSKEVEETKQESVGKLRELTLNTMVMNLDEKEDCPSDEENLSQTAITWCRLRPLAFETDQQVWENSGTQLKENRVGNSFFDDCVFECDWVPLVIIFTDLPEPRALCGDW